MNTPSRTWRSGTQRQSWGFVSPPGSPIECLADSQPDSEGDGAGGTYSTPESTSEEKRTTTRTGDIEQHEHELLVSASAVHAISIVCSCGASGLIDWRI